MEFTDASMRLMNTSGVCSPLSMSHLELPNFVSQERPPGSERQEDASMESEVKLEPPDVKAEDEAIESSAASQQKVGNIGAFQSDMNIMFQSRGFQDETPIAGASVPAPADDAEDPLASAPVSVERKPDRVKKPKKSRKQKKKWLNVEYEENTEQKKTSSKQCVQTKARIEDKDADVTEIICNVEIELDRASNSDTEHEGFVPDNHSVFAEKLSLIPHLTTHEVNNLKMLTEAAKAITSKKNPDEKPHQCTYCNKTFRRVFNLNNHLLIHTCEKPHQCTYCNKGFTQKGHLKRHILIHTGEIRHQCSYCNKAYFEKKDLEQHILTHTSDRTNRCSSCNKVFSCKGDLQRHILIHTGEKPHLCSYCNKGFTQKNNLKRHILIHTGEKPFWCTICDKAFTGKGDLKRHLLIHTGERPHRCSICKKTFTHKANLNKHIILLHKKKSTPQQNSTKKVSPEKVSPEKVSTEK